MPHFYSNVNPVAASPVAQPPKRRSAAVGWPKWLKYIVTYKMMTVGLALILFGIIMNDTGIEDERNRALMAMLGTMLALLAGNLFGTIGLMYYGLRK